MFNFPLNVLRLLSMRYMWRSDSGSVTCLGVRGDVTVIWDRSLTEDTRADQSSDTGHTFNITSHQPFIVCWENYFKEKVTSHILLSKVTDSTIQMADGYRNSLNPHFKYKKKSRIIIFHQPHLLKFKWNFSFTEFI